MIAVGIFTVPVCVCVQDGGSQGQTGETGTACQGGDCPGRWAWWVMNKADIVTPPIFMSLRKSPDNTKSDRDDLPVPS